VPPRIVRESAVPIIPSARTGLERDARPVRTCTITQHWGRTAKAAQLVTKFAIMAGVYHAQGGGVMT
jgi:hypothetical protein